MIDIEAKEVRGWIELMRAFPEEFIFLGCMILSWMLVHYTKKLVKPVWTTNPKWRKFFIRIVSLVGSWFLSQWVMRKLGFDDNLAQVLAITVALSNSIIYEMLINVCLALNWMKAYELLKGRSLVPTSDGGVKSVNDKDETIRYFK